MPLTVYVVCMYVVTLSLLTRFGYADIQGEGQRLSPQRIAIVGGGIAGSSASFFLREKFGNEVEVDIFEPSPILCGRVANVRFEGREYECGGSIIHPRNLYMKSFLETFPDLEVAERRPGSLGLFDGVDYILRGSKWSFLQFLLMFWTYGFDLFRISLLESEFLNKFDRIYKLQHEGQSYNDVASLLYATGGIEFYNTTQITSSDLFSGRYVSDFTIKNLIAPGIRVNYGQDENVNGFVGAVAMAGIQSGLWSVKGGNKKVCYALVEKSGANVIKEKVVKVLYDASNSGGKFRVSSNEVNASSTPLTITRPYDIVIVTSPIGPNLNNIDLTGACSDLENCPKVNDGSLEYRRTVANFVKGKLKASLFQCDSVESCPSAIFITNGNLFYRSIGLHMPVDYDPKTDSIDASVYKVFSTEPLTNKQLGYLFDSYSKVTLVDWRAYPLYHVPEKLGSTVLNPNGLYYTSPIEWAASAIEMSTISAKNAVLSAYNNWYGITAKINSNLHHTKLADEL